MVSELLSRGKDNAKTTEELIVECHFASRRELTLQIARERKDGALICSTTSGNGGYYLPGSRAEVADFIRSMDKRAKNTFNAIKAARRYLKQIDGQISMEESKMDK